LGEEELGITFRNIFDKVGVAWMKRVRWVREVVEKK
jgi:hypothetical protein